MNRVFLLGRLTADPNVKYTQTGKTVATFTLAVDRPFAGQQGQREADFINIVVFGRQAELIGNSCRKGHRLLIDGRIQIRSYDDKDGVKKWITEVVAFGFEFIERRSEIAGSLAPVDDSLPKGVDEALAGVKMDELGEEVPF